MDRHESDDHRLKDRSIVDHTLKTETCQINRLILEVGQVLRHRSTDSRRVLQAVSARAVGKDEILLLRMRTDYQTKQDKVGRDVMTDKHLLLIEIVIIVETTPSIF